MILGRNGAGKSSLLRALLGQVKSGGQIIFCQQEISAWPSWRRVQKGMSLVPEGRRVFASLSVRENLELGGFSRPKEIKENMEEVLALFPVLKERLEVPAGALSGGEQQMLAIGRAMMADPRLLILDEPSLGLSPLLVDEMFTLIQDLNESGLSVFLVEQNVMQSLEIAARAYVIENGCVVLSGDADSLINDPELKKTYLPF
jgi:branched-chain amino acid transport system ATP-binding protein